MILPRPPLPARRSGPSLAPAPQAQSLTSFLGFILPRLPTWASAPSSPNLAGRRPSTPSRRGLTPLACIPVHGPQPSCLRPFLHAPPVPYPPANRCTSVSLWLILSPACPPGAEAGRGSGRPQRPAVSVPDRSRTAPAGRRGELAETRLKKVTGSALPAACSRAASSSSSALTTRAGERRGCRERVGAGA